MKSKVGEPWNEVYSQLSQQLDANTMIGRHVIGHLWDYVERNVEFIDDIPYRKPCLGYYSSLLNAYRCQFYIHPETGILCSADLAPRKRKKDKSSANDVIILDDYHQYCKINDIWYVCTFADFPPSPTRYVYDAIKGLVYREQATYVMGKFIYAVSKEQCGKRQLKFIKNQLRK